MSPTTRMSAPDQPALVALGWDEAFALSFASLGLAGDVEPGRVVSEHRGGYRVATGWGEVTAELSGRLRFKAVVRSELPAVGDWVALAGAAVQAVLPRRTVFTRRDPDPRVGDQVLAANVDVAFLVTSLNREFSLRRLERYLAMAWSSGAQPVVILSKADLVSDLEDRFDLVRGIAAGVPIVAVSVPLELGVDEVRTLLSAGRTAVFLGSSGVGKSTLINALAGRAMQAIGDVREDDDRGRHTTSGRQLLTLPDGWLVIDTPGLRSIELSDDAAEDLGQTFADVQELASLCRFSDCRHQGEPACAVRAAIADGRLPIGRLESHRKLQREMARVTRATDPAARAAHRSKWRAIHRAVNDHMHRKYGADR
jgi:ribosome biogenesis GTPase / thiamine phosphate phosphatase